MRSRRPTEFLDVLNKSDPTYQLLLEQDDECIKLRSFAASSAIVAKYLFEPDDDVNPKAFRVNCQARLWQLSGRVWQLSGKTVAIDQTYRLGTLWRCCGDKTNAPNGFA